MSWSRNHYFYFENRTVAAAAAAVSDLLTFTALDVAHMGYPFVEGSVDASDDLETMDIAHMGEPFVRVAA